jgi:hypothetical protein
MIIMPQSNVMPTSFSGGKGQQHAGHQQHPETPEKQGFPGQQCENQTEASVRAMHGLENQKTVYSCIEQQQWQKPDYVSQFDAFLQQQGMQR